jgi:hypothetical protein
MANATAVDLSDYPAARLRRLATTLAILYLSAPVALFFWFWLHGAAAALALAALGYACKRALDDRTGPAAGAITGTEGAVFAYCVIVAVVFGLLTVPTKEAIAVGDFEKHDLILHNLIDYPWPVTFFQESDSRTILRYSFAYYLVPAAIAKVVGREFAPYLLLAWTSGGLLLLFVYVAGIARNRILAAVFVPVVALFSGLDAAVYLLLGQPHTGFPTALLDAWSRGTCLWLIGSTPFAFQWTPQHATAASLGAIVLFETWHHRRFSVVASAVFAALVLWSPFVAFSFGALAVTRIAGGSRASAAREILTWKNAPVIAVIGVLILFIFADAQGIRSDWCIGQMGPADFAGRYFLFVAIEFGVLAALIALARPGLGSLEIAAIALMCALLFTRIGGSSDLQMRGSQLPMMLLAFSCIETLQSSGRRLVKVLLAAVAAVGSVAGAQEIYRGGIDRRVAPSHATKAIFDVDWLPHFESSNHYVTQQYVARVPSPSLLDALLARAPAGFSVDPVPVDLRTLVWREYGKAAFDAATFTVRSDQLTDAALFSEAIVLPAGFYRLDVDLDWDVTSEKTGAYEHGGHVSFHGQRKIMNLVNSRAQNRRRVAYFHWDGSPVQIAFGLGGWGRGMGYIRMRDLRLARITVQAIR